MRRKFAMVVAAAVFAVGWLGLAESASGDDHLANATTSPGAAHRGFTNPVATNPSATSGPAAQPGTVPGLGDPKSGMDRGTPSFDCASLAERLAARSQGTGPACD